jgi:cobalt-zinc-cadmium efflux system protein
MAVSHDHGAHGHIGQGERRLFWVAVVTGTFMLVEAIGGLLAGSLALIADAGHMLADVTGLVLAWFAFRVSRWPADGRRTYGFSRLQILVAFGNGLALFVIAGFVIVEAVRRLGEPVEVLGGPMLAVAIVGLVVNIGAFLILHGADRTNLNIRAATLHVVGDLLGSVGAIAAAAVVLATGWTAADPVAAMLVAAIILRSAWFVVRDSAHILLEGAPLELPISEIAADLRANVAGIEDIHHLHVWSITQEQPMVTLHATIDRDADAFAAVRAIKTRLRSRFGIEHATVEVEKDGCADPGIARERAHVH